MSRSPVVCVRPLRRCRRVHGRNVVMPQPFRRHACPQHASEPRVLGRAILAGYLTPPRLEQSVYVRTGCFEDGRHYQTLTVIRDHRSGKDSRFRIPPPDLVTVLALVLEPTIPSGGCVHFRGDLFFGQTFGSSFLDRMVCDHDVESGSFLCIAPPITHAPDPNRGDLDAVSYLASDPNGAVPDRLSYLADLVDAPPLAGVDTVPGILAGEGDAERGRVSVGS